VKAVNKVGESLPLTTFDGITAKDPYGKPDKPGKPEATGKRRETRLTRRRDGISFNTLNRPSI